MSDDCGPLEIYNSWVDVEISGCNCAGYQLEEGVPLNQAIVVNQIGCASLEFSVNDCLDIYNPTWNLGDGTEELVGTTIDHFFCTENPETFEVSVTLTDTDGNSQILTTEVAITCTIGNIEIETEEIPCSESCEGVFIISSDQNFTLEWDNIFSTDQSYIQDLPNYVKVSNICEQEYIATITWENGCVQEIMQSFISDVPTVEGNLVFDESTDMSLYAGSQYFEGTITIASDIFMDDVHWFFNENRGIEIEENASLSLTNFSLEGCEGTWNGIEVLSVNSTPGELHLTNGEVQEAHVAIQTSDLNPQYNTVNGFEVPVADEVNGGLINVQNAEFKNNLLSISIKDAVSIDNEIGFRNCQFIVNDGLYNQFAVDLFDYSIEDERFESHVDYEQVQGYNLLGCHFINEINNPEYFVNGWIDRGVGVKLFNAKLEINKLAEDPLSTSTFNGFNFGIEELVVSDPWNGLRVLNSRFDANRVGIFVQNACFHDIIGNTFNIGPTNELHTSLQEADVDYEGMFQLDGAYYIIAENSFHTIGQPLYDNFHIGLRIRDTDARDNEVYHNNFTGLTRGCLAEGDNSGNGDWDNFGLRFVCNTFVECISDITVTEYDGLNIAEVSMEQFGLEHDEDGMPIGLDGPEEVNFEGIRAGNNFSETGIPEQDEFGHFFNFGSLIFYWCGDESECPNEELVYNLESISSFDLESSNQCAPISGVIEDGIFNEYTSVPTHWNDNLNETEDVLNSLEYLLHAIIDGGDSETLQNEVDFAWVEDTWVMRDKLLNESPNLSEDVLRNVASNTVTFPHPIALEIFMANPDVLRKADFIKYLEIKEDPMPNYMIELLLASRSQETFRTSLNRNMAIATAVHQSSISLINRIWRQNYFTSFDSIQSTTDLRTTHDFYRQNQSLIFGGSFMMAQAQYDDFAINANLNGKDWDNFSAFQAWLDLELEKSDWSNSQNLSDSQISELFQLANSFWMFKSGQFAMAYLNKHFGTHYFIPAVRNEAIQRNSEITPPIVETKIEAYPIPADNNLYVRLEGETAEWYIEVFDLQSRVVQSHTSDIHQNLFIFQTSTLSSGSYFVKATNKETGETCIKRFEVQH